MKILYVGCDSGTSGHRLNALRRLGHEVQVIDPAAYVPGVPGVGVWRRYFGSVGLAALIRRRMLEQLAKFSSFDLAWVDSGGFVARELVQDLKRIGKVVINYNVDDPYGSRDLNTWYQYRRAVQAYDLVVVVRKENVDEARSLGAKKVLRVYRAADEVAHVPLDLSAEERARWQTEVLFIGTAFPERGPFFAELVRRDLPLSIYGSDWQKLKEWKTIRPCWKGQGLVERYTYAAAIQSAKVCLGLLSHENRDLHTTRSLEIPSLGGVFCAERTEEHLALYEEGKEAVFWSSAEECAEKCRALLADDEWRRSIGENGRKRYLENGWTNMKVAERILKEVFE